MGGQLDSLLVELSTKVQSVERLLSTLLDDRKETLKELGAIRVKLAQLEQDGKWVGEERRKIDGRLHTGDGKFQTLQRDVAEALRIARSCQVQLQERETSARRKVLWKLVEVGAPLLAALLMQIIYHVLMIGPQIAEAIKKAGGH